MNFKLIFDIAKALLLARWRQTLVAAIGVTFSIGMFITLLSFMNGLNDMLDGLILNRTPHIRLYNEIKPNVNQPINLAKSYHNHYNFIRSIKASGSRQAIYNNGAVMQALSNDKRVLGFSPKITAQVFFNDGVVDITGAVNGIDVQKENKLFHFGEYIIAGTATDLDKIPNSIVLGKDLGDKLLAELGDVVQVTTAKGEIFQLKVVGYFQSGIQELDKTQSYASIMTAQKLLGQSANYITDIQIKLKDMNQAPGIAKEYRQLFVSDAEDIQTANAQFETGSFVRTLISYAVGVTLLIVAGFGIYNILNMMIFEKMDTIAILKAIGFSGKDVKSIFLVIALSIGFFGGLLGLMLGLGLSAIIDQVPFTTASLPTIKTYPISYSITFYVIGTVFSLVTTFLAGWFPSRKASQVDPVIIIRGK
ncbi:MAG: FtsX-like permease family protein [Dyadobacter sp.]|uniref:ABC transporter permease n=1 Tax=Dyadobacter sp. TaxID=1914288 RepID=UPI003265D2EA